MAPKTVPTKPAEPKPTAKAVPAKPAGTKSPAVKAPAAKPASATSAAETAVTQVVTGDTPPETKPAEGKKAAKEKKVKVKAPKPPKKKGKGVPLEKWLCLGTLVISSLLAVAFLLDMIMGMPFGGHSAPLDIISFLSCAIIAYLAWDTGREI